MSAPRDRAGDRPALSNLTAAFGVLAVALLLLASGLVPAAPGPGPSAPGGLLPDPLRSSASPPSAPSTSVRADPFVGVSSPGMPRIHLSTYPMLTGNCPNVTYSAAWLAYDSADTTFWIASPGSCVDVFNTSGGQGFTAAIQVGSDPFGVAIDNSTDTVFVTNTGSDNVSVLSASTERPLASVPVGSSPYGVAYDWRTDEVYVANAGSDNVSVISASTYRVVASISVGPTPVGIVSDPRSGHLFVANNGGYNVSVISDRTHAVAATVPVGNSPYGLALDNASDQVFVTNQGSNNVTVLDGPTGAPLATIPVVAPAADLQGIAYNAATDEMWIGAGVSWAVSINASRYSVTGYASVDPSGAAYDSDQGTVCMTNTANRSFLCIGAATPLAGGPTTSLTFHESGLPLGTAWSVSVNVSGFPFTAQFSNTPDVVFEVLGNFWGGAFFFAIPWAGGYLPGPSQGLVYVNASPVTVNVSFPPPSGPFPVTFVETGLPSGTGYWVDLAGQFVWAVSPRWTISEPNGSYSYSVWPPPYFTAIPPVGAFTVAGSGVTVNLTFVPGPWTFGLTFLETGLPTGSNWSVTLDGVSASAPSPGPISFLVRNGTHDFVIPPLRTYAAFPSSGTVGVDGSSLTIAIAFAPREGPFPVWFNETGLPLGTLWAVTLGGSTLTSVNAGIEFLATDGTYPFLVSVPVGFSAAVRGGTVSVAGTGVSEEIAFVPVPLPLSANFSYQIEYASCLSDGGVTNYLLLGGEATGGTAPYSYSWVLPTGSATGALAATSMTYGRNNTVTLAVSDSVGRSATASGEPSMWLPPCPPPARNGTQSISAASLSLDQWAILGLSAALVSSLGVALWLGLRVRRGGRPPN